MQDQGRMVRFQVCLPTRYVAVMRREAQRCGVSLAEVIRELLRDGVDVIERRQQVEDSEDSQSEDHQVDRPRDNPEMVERLRSEGVKGLEGVDGVEGDSVDDALNSFAFFAG